MDSSVQASLSELPDPLYTYWNIAGDSNLHEAVYLLYRDSKSVKVMSFFFFF